MVPCCVVCAYSPQGADVPWIFRLPACFNHFSSAKIRCFYVAIFKKEMLLTDYFLSRAHELRNVSPRNGLV